MDIKQEIDRYNRTKRQEGEPVMTQRRLAELSGMTPETVTRHATGRLPLPAATESKYRKALGLEAVAA